MHFPILAQTPTPNTSNFFYITLGTVFLIAIVTTVITKWARDKCLKLFHGYHVTVERLRGQTIWGTLNVYSSGVEITFDHPYPDHRGRQKSSFLLYQPEVDQQVLSLFRYAGELDARGVEARNKQIHSTFNPGPLRRCFRSVRNFLNTLRDAFSAALGTIVGQYQRLNPANMVLNTQGTQVTQLGQTLLGRFANAYEPLLEHHIGQPVILQVVDPLNPNNENSEYTGYLASYTQSFVAVLAVAHQVIETATVTLPNIERGDFLPPLPAPPAPGAPRIELPPPMKTENCIAIRMDGRRMLLQNTNHHPVVLRKFDREGFETFALGLTLPPNGTVELPAAQSKGATITFEVLSEVDIVAPRKFATVRHAGKPVQRRGFFDELQDEMPLVPKLFGGRNGKDVDEEAEPTQEQRAQME